jgi:hypothetical protein
LTTPTLEIGLMPKSVCRSFVDPSACSLSASKVTRTGMVISRVTLRIDSLP